MILSFNCMITLYTPKITTKSIFAHFKHKGKYVVTVRIPCLYVLPLSAYAFTSIKSIENIHIFVGDILAINNLLIKSSLIKWLMNSNAYYYNNIYNKIIFTY